MHQGNVQSPVIYYMHFHLNIFSSSPKWWSGICIEWGITSVSDEIKDGDIVHSIAQSVCEQLIHSLVLVCLKHKINCVYMSGSFIHIDIFQNWIMEEIYKRNSWLGDVS